MEENNQPNPMPIDSANVNTQAVSNGTHPVMGGFWERLGAYLIDSFIISMVSTPVNFMLGGFRVGATSMITPDTAQDLPGALGMMSGLMGLSSILSLGLYLAIAYFYFGYFYSTKGQTPGKMLLKLKVVKAIDLSYLDYNTAFLRDGLMKMVSSLAINLGFFWYFATPKRQTWHDLVAHTYVVKTDDNGNILMNGPESYPANKAKAFAFPCGCCLAYVLMIVVAVISIGGAVSSQANKAKQHQQQIQQQLDMMQQESSQLNNSTNGYDGEYNGSESDIDQMNQLNQRNQQELDQMMQNYRNTPESN